MKRVQYQVTNNFQNMGNWQKYNRQLLGVLMTRGIWVCSHAFILNDKKASIFLYALTIMHPQTGIFTLTNNHLNIFFRIFADTLE